MRSNYGTNKRWNVPLEEALELAGEGMYTNFIICISGFSVLCGVTMIQCMSMVLPAAGCELELTSVQKGTLASVALGGMVLSSHLFGILADVFGRGRVTAFSNLFSAITALLGSLATDAISMSVIWFINGLLLAGVFTPVFVYVCEFCPFRTRARALLLTSAFGSLGCTVLPCLAWLILPMHIEIPLIKGIVFSSWRLYIALMFIPSFLSFVFLHLAPESPKFLLSQGKSEETLKILKDQFSVNKKRSRDEYPVYSVCLDSDDVSDRKSGEKNNMSNFLQTMWNQTIILFSPPLMLYTVVSCILQFGFLAAYNVITLWLPSQTDSMMNYMEVHPAVNLTLCRVMSSSDVSQQTTNECEVNYELFLMSAVMGIIQFFMYFITNIITNIIGRKSLIVLFIFISAVSCCVMTFLTDIYFIFFSLALISVLLGAAFPVTLSILVGLFPTYLRSTATSICMMFGRIGGFGGSQLFGVLFQHYCFEGYFGLSALLVGVGFLTAFVPLKRKTSDEK